jgi:hypothetical protein
MKITIDLDKPKWTQRQLVNVPAADACDAVAMLMKHVRAAAKHAAPIVSPVMKARVAKRQAIQ